MAKQSYFLFLSLVSLCSSDVINPPTIFPTNPTTTPPATTYNPVTNPVTTTPPATTYTPVINPVTTVPSTLTPPVTNPVTQYPSGMVPVVAPPVPLVPGQSWCVAKPGASPTSLQLALDYACGIGGADCSEIQEGGNCYSPISLQNHASFAFNSYYQKNPSSQSCDFGGAASLVTTNPSTGSCIYQTVSSTSTPVGTATPTPSTQTVNQPPTTQTINQPPATPTINQPPATPTGGGIIGVGTPPTVFNPANPTSNNLNNPSSGGAAVYGFDGSPTGNNPTSSDSTYLQFHFGHVLVATLILQAVLFH